MTTLLLALGGLALAGWSAYTLARSDSPRRARAGIPARRRLPFRRRP
jgi:hypothetical protein